MNIKRPIVLCCCLAVSDIFSQSTITVTEDLLEEKMESLAGSSQTIEPEELSLHDELLHLEQLCDEPVDLNNSNKRELEASRLFSMAQITSLLHYIKRYGPLMRPEELQVIPGFDPPSIRRILPFITVGEPLPRAPVMENRPKHTLFIRYRQIMEPQKGYTDNRYKGSPLQLYSRYRLNLRSGVKLGFTAEKDAGERFFGGSQKQGFDFYSAYAYFQSPDKRYLFIIGDFHARFGQGVALNSGNAVAKGAEVLQIKQVSSPLLPSTSSNESHFFRGVGTSIKLNSHWQSTLFFSRLSIDALIEENIKGQEEITSMPSTGNHRTDSELEKKKQAVRYSTGTRISRSGRYFVTGLSAFFTTANRPLSRHAASGESSLHDQHHQKRIGGDVSWQLKNATFFAEYSRDDHLRTAWMGGILISLDHRLSLGLLKRQYEKGFSSTFTNAFREGTAVANEEGTYFSIELLFPVKTQLTAYYDLFYFPWMKYRTAAPSEGQGGFIQLRKSLGKEMQFLFRFKSERKQVNGPAEKPLPAITTEKTSGFRLELIHQAHSSLRFKSRIEQSFYKAEGMKEEKGILIFQEVKFQKKGSPFAIACRHALFDTDSYQTRIYAYENDVLYAFSIPSYSGRGSRSYLLLKYRFGRHLTCWLRYARTFFNDRFTIGSGEEQISGNSKTELKFQVRLNF